MSNYRVAIIRNGLVSDVLIVTRDFKPQPGTIAVPSDTANIGDHFDGHNFTTSVSPQQKNVLLAYATRKKDGISRQGLSITFSEPGKPIMVIQVDTSPNGRTDLAGLVASAQSDPTFTDVWYQSNGEFTLNASQILQINSEVQNFISQVWRIYGRIVNSINSGAITTIPEVDNPETVMAGTTRMLGWPPKS